MDTQKTPAISSAVHVKGTTKIVGIFGDPVTYTLSPKMHNYAFAKLNLDFIYVPFSVRPEQLKSAVESIRSLNLAGVNVTIPHKEAVIPYLDELTPSAKNIGAVNTIVNHHGKLVGHNTDAPGFLISLKEDGKYNPEGKRALILGAGGASRAMTMALLEAGLEKLVIMNRELDFERAEALDGHLKKVYPAAKIYSHRLSEEVLRDELKQCDLFLNATPMGLDMVSQAFHTENILSPHLFVFDAVYAKVTPLILAAQKAGSQCLGGMGMLIHQGALAFSLWTGLEPPSRLMREALDDGEKG